MSRRKGRSSVIGATALAATAAFGLPGVAYAQTTDELTQSESARPGPGRHGPNLETAAGVLNLNVDNLRTKLLDGKTLAQVASEQGVEVQTLIDALVAKATERIDQEVADGELTAEQAAARKAGLPERIKEQVNNNLPARGPGGPPPLDAAATVLNLGVDDLRTKVKDGKTLAQVATEQGVDVQNVIDALVADAIGKIDQAVADGKLTADQATERKANLVERITRMVNEGLPARGEDGRGSPPPDGPEGSSQSN